MLQQIISNSYKNAKRIKLNSNSKFILFSDVHRGDNSYADDFSNNRNLLAFYFDGITSKTIEFPYFNDRNYVHLQSITEIEKLVRLQLIISCFLF